MSSAEGDRAVAAAEKKLKGNMFGFGKDPDGAIDDFKRACNNFKVASEYNAAARCQMRIAEIAEKQGEYYEVASACMEAAKLHIRAGGVDAAVKSLQKAKYLYIQNGKVTQAARACKELANAVKDGGEDEKILAMRTFTEAAQLYDSESQYTEKHKMHLEAATLKCELGQYLEAAQLFESVANDYVNNNLLKYSARDHYMNAILCYMAVNDTSTAANKREEFVVNDVTFEDSRQNKLVSNCLGAMLAGKDEDFATAVSEYDSITKLDKFRVELLLAAKRHISTNVGGGVDFAEDDEEDLT
eukprot:TRINITY_DN4300_c0_g1_i1.p1 TRINITY_DN4300_c0_g1~~TRINITY_DN4300_c0_g1_i1.p1  ORF type:complete len:333 (+),score=61.24 TRINITY_DN4300_c0_g1_i1:100-999(+)